MPLAAAVIDRSGETVTANALWLAVAPDLAEHLSPVPVGAQRLRIRSVPAVVDVRASRMVAGDITHERCVELRVAEIGAGDFRLVTCADVASLEPHDDGLAFESRHPLTGLPGRRLFLELLGHAMTMSDRHRYQPAALAIGITGLDEVEANHGLAARTELIVAVASRLRASLRPGDVVAHTGDERFAVMLPDVDGSYLAEGVSYRLSAVVNRPFRLGGASADVELFIGVGTSVGAKHPETVMVAAERALEEARQIPVTPGSDTAGRVVVADGAGHTISVHDATTDGSAIPAAAPRQRRIDVTELREEELISYFQPVLDITDGRVVAGEALMRWRHPHYGVLSAGEFLGLAVNNGLLATLTDQALVCSTETWAEIRDQLGPEPPRLFVNLSPEQLLSRVAVERLYHLLIATGLPATDVVVEVTEEAMSTRFGEMLDVLNEIRSHGLRVALDDFGSGYSSLGRLRHLPIDVIKVDQSLVRGLENDRRARQLLAAVSTMVTELEVDCIVEGIETAAEAAIVKDLGFRYVQGYHFARPQPADEFAKLTGIGMAVRGASS